MKLNKQCEYCGQLINYDTYNDKWGDASPVVHIVTKRKIIYFFTKIVLPKSALQAQCAYQNNLSNERSSNE